MQGVFAIRDGTDGNANRRVDLMGETRHRTSERSHFLALNQLVACGFDLYDGVQQIQPAAPQLLEQPPDSEQDDHEDAAMHQVGVQAAGSGCIQEWVVAVGHADAAPYSAETIALFGMAFQAGSG